MNKEAMNPLEAFISAGLTGAGGYGALRLVQEVINAKKDKERLAAPPGMQIRVPADMVEPPKEKEASLSDTLLSTLAVAGGIPAGIYGADKLYGYAKKRQLEAEIQEEQKKRLELMQQFKQAAELPTPHVDAFCAGLADKLAWAGLEDAWAGFRGKNDNYVRAGKAMDDLGNDAIPFGDELLLAGLGLGTGASVYTLASMLKAREAKRRAEARAYYPEEASLVPQPV